MIGKTLVNEMVAHASSLKSEEVCGLVVEGPSGQRLVRGVNTARNKTVTFDMDPSVWLSLEDGEEAVAVYHSHVMCGPEPSQADRAMCEATALPWHIVTAHGSHYYWEPDGFEAPYEKRQYVYGVHDCYSLVRDYYRREFGILLRDYPRPDPKRWNDSLERNFTEEGFHVVPDGVARVGDVMLIQVAARFTNHCAIYVGDGKILHHVDKRLSKVDPFGGYWQKNLTYHVRHIDVSAE